MDINNNMFNSVPVIPQFVSPEDKAMEFYEKLLKDETDSSVRKELVKSYSQLIIKRIELNQQYAENASKFNLRQLEYNAEIYKLDRQIQIETIKRNKI